MVTIGFLKKADALWVSATNLPGYNAKAQTTAPSLRIFGLGSLASQTSERSSRSPLWSVQLQETREFTAEEHNGADSLETHRRRDPVSGSLVMHRSEPDPNSGNNPWIEPLPSTKPFHSSSKNTACSQPESGSYAAAS